MARPCYYAGLAWLVACLIGGWLSTNVLLVVTIGSIFCIILWALIPKLRQYRTLWFTAVAFVSALIVLCGFQLAVYLPMEQKVGDEVYLEAYVSSNDDGVVLTVTDGQLPSNIRLTCWSADPEWQLYDRVSGRFTLCRYEEGKLRFLQRKASGVYFAVLPEQVSSQAGQAPFWAFFGRWRDDAVACVERYLRGDEAALTTGICFGADGQLSAEARSAFQVGGLSHILSVSGFHMTMICQVLLWLLTAFGLRRRLANGLTVVCLLLFMAVVGTEAPVIRSGVLCLFVLISHCFRRQADSRNSLGAALLLLLVGSPFAAYDVGLLLSFSATFGLVVLYPKLKAAIVKGIPIVWNEKAPRLCAVLTKMVDLVCVTLAATIASLPIVVMVFGELSVVSVLTNLVVTLPLTVVLIVGWFGCLFHWLIGAPAFMVCGGICHIVLEFVKKIAKIPFVTVAIRDTYLLLWIVGTGIVLWIGYRFAARRGIRIGASVSAVVLCIAVCLHTAMMHKVTEVTVFPTEGDTAICLSHEGERILIVSPSDENTLYVISTQLRLLGVERVDTLVLLGGDASLALPMTVLLGDVLTDTRVLYSDEAAQWAPAFKQARLLTDERETVADELVMQRYDSFLAIRIRGTRMMVCNGSQSVYELPKGLRSTDLVVFGSGIARDAMLFEDAVAVIQGEGRALPGEAWESMAYVTAAADTQAVRLLTRGYGDIR